MCEIVTVDAYDTSKVLSPYEGDCRIVCRGCNYSGDPWGEVDRGLGVLGEEGDVEGVGKYEIMIRQVLLMN